MNRKDKNISIPRSKETAANEAVAIADLLGIEVYRKRSGPSATYRITETRVHKIHGEQVYLKCTHKGGRSTWKWIGLLWWDYDRATSA